MDASKSGAAPAPLEMESPPAGPFAGVHTVVVNGVTLAYREQGEGEPVVFVHGSVSDLRAWEHQLPAIGASHRAIAYSRRYARPNTDIAAEADDPMAPHVDDLLAFLRVVDAEPAHLVGHSWGGFVCLLAAIRCPQAVRSLVLQEPPVLSLFIGTRPHPGEVLRLLLRRPRTAATILGFAVRTAVPGEKAFQRGDDEAAIATFADGLIGKGTYDGLADERKQQARDNVRAFRAQVLGVGFPPLADHDVRGLQVPTLLMTGRLTPRYLVRLTERLHQLLPRAERVEIDAASHVMSEQNPGAVNEAIVAFLARAAVSRAGS